MKNRYIILLLLFVFVIEGALLVPWIIPIQWQTKLSLAPYFSLVALIIFSMQRNRYLGGAVGLAIGMAQDIVYASPMLGPHAFSMAFATYAAGYAASKIRMNIALTFLIISLSLFIYDTTLFSVYHLFRITPITYKEMFAHHLPPTLLFNLLFAVLIYAPMRKMLDMKPDNREDEG